MDTTRGSFLGWLESNLVSIVLAILLALTVWIVATQEVNPVETVDFDRPVPIEYAGLPSDLIVTNEATEAIRVTYRASQTTRRSLVLDDFHAVADLSGLSTGSYDVPVDVTIDGQATFMDATPSTVHVEIEQLSSRSVPIQLVVQGSLPIGYRSASPVLTPENATVTGPRSEVELVSEVRATVSVDGQRDTMDESAELVALDSEGAQVPGVTLNPETIDVRIPIVQEADFREVAVRVNANVLTAPGYYVSRLTPNPPLVPVRGDPDVLRSLTAIETEPINLQGVTEDTSVIAQLDPPEGVTLEEVETVEVTITVVAQPDFQVVEAPVRISGLDSGLDANVAPSSAVISLSGPLPVLQQLDPANDIRVTVDLSGLEPGSYQIEPSVQIVNPDVPAESLQDVTIESVLPTLFEVEIQEADTEGAS
jgi:YbbR domain-containing protein